VGLIVASPLGPGFAQINNQVLVGKQFVSVERYGKLVIFELDGGVSIIAHLGMSGRFVLRPPGDRHDHFSLRLSPEIFVTYNDFRRMGRIWIGPSGLKPPLPTLGPDALSRDFCAGTLAIPSRQAIKVLIMRQQVVAGLGNIYASESLFQAGIYPRRPAETLTNDERLALVVAIKRTLKMAIKHGGSTLDDYRGTEGVTGNFEEYFDVYGREGQLCRRCDGRSLIARTVIDQRATYFCSRCQY
jgi:formamidopyrimidine-DNA glycosylase